MSAIDANWGRWSLASVCKYLRDTFKNDSMVNWPVYIMGVDLGEESDYLDPSYPARLSAFAEFSTRHASKGEYWITLELTLILTTAINPTQAFYHQSQVGTLESKIPQCLALKRLGADLVDTGAVFCILNLSDPDISPKSYPSLGTATKVSQSIYQLTYKGVVDAN